MRNDDEMDKKGTIVLLHGFLMENELNHILKEEFSDYEVIRPNLYDFIKGEGPHSINWLENIKNYLAEIASEKGDLTLVGYTMGSVIATHCESLSFVKEVILISPDFYFLNMLTTNSDIAHVIRVKYIESKDINYGLFQINYDKLFNGFEEAIKASTKKMLILVGVDHAEIGYTRILRTFLMMDNPNKQMISIGTGEQELLSDMKAIRYVQSAMRLFLDQDEMN